MKILDHGWFRLVDSMGDDLRIVNLARQSFGARREILQKSDEALIHRLMKDRHGTPFEGVVFCFSVKCPIFVAREWFRHRIASYNELSGRYSKMTPEFYLPAAEQVRSQIGKAMNYTFESMSPEHAVTYRQMMKETCENSFTVYEMLLNHGVAKEVARDVLPLNTYTQFTTTINLRSALNFVNQRSHPSALWEIQQYSNVMETVIKSIVPVAYKAFIENNRVAP